MEKLSVWFIDNPIAAKILMVLIILAGLMAYPSISKQFFPRAEIDFVSIDLVYPGAGTDEIESQMVKRIEEAISSIGGIEEVTASVSEGAANISIEVDSSYDAQSVFNEVSSAVDSITTFPINAEPPRIAVKPYENTMMSLKLSGDLTETELKELGESIREELANLPSVALANIGGTRPYEVSIEIPPLELQRLELTIDQVANLIRGYSFSQPSGKIKSENGDIQLQARLQADDVEDFKNTPIIISPNGDRVLLGDIADIKYGFEEIDFVSRVNGLPALSIYIINRENPQILKTSEAVHHYVEQKNLILPDGITLEVWWDMSHSYKGRLDTLVKNGSSGLLLVFLVLVLFLRPVLAAWVSVGIGVAFLGALWAMSLTSVNLNILSMLAFITILGIIVDDAIIVGESVHSHQQSSGNLYRGAVAGTKAVLSPVIFAVVSTIVFFVPFFWLSENPNTAHMAVPVIVALIFSLIEALLLLPSHLGGSNKKSNLKKPISKFSNALSGLSGLHEKIANSIPTFAENRYAPTLTRAISSPGYVMFIFLILFAMAISFSKSGWLNFAFAPRVAADWVTAKVTLADNAPFSQMEDIVAYVEEEGQQLKEEINTELNYPLISGVNAYNLNNVATVQLRLIKENYRPMSAQEIASLWRERLGQIPSAKDLTVNYTVFDIPKPFEINIRSDHTEQLVGYINELTDHLRSVEGVYDIRSTLEDPVREINYRINEYGQSVDISEGIISSQIRQAFFGEEVQRIPTVREDVRVYVRYPKTERSYVENLENMEISLASGEYVPLHSIAEFEIRDVQKNLSRVDEKRVVKLSADITRGFDIKEITEKALSYGAETLSGKYPDVIIDLKGEQQDSNEFYGRLQLYFVMSLLCIYGLMAVMFRSYWQPFLVISAIPFGYVGGVFGHVIMGIDLAMMSMLGMLACAGVVVNDNMVLVNKINSLRGSGYSTRKAAIEGAKSRFRAIVLTSATTFIGLTPILFEQSVQARFMIPMVVSLAFGVLFATIVTLFFVPCLYVFSASWPNRFRRLFSATSMTDKKNKQLQSDL